MIKVIATWSDNGTSQSIVKESDIVLVLDLLKLNGVKSVTVESVKEETK